MVTGAVELEQREFLSEYRRQFSPGEVIHTEGEAAERAYLLEEGRVRVVKRVGAVERSLRVVRPGDLFGESALLEGAERTSTAISLSECTVLAFNRSELKQLLALSPAIGLRISEQLVLRARMAEDRVEISMVRDAQQKVVMGVLRAAQRELLQRRDSPRSLILPLSPLELSANIGLDVDAVKRAVHQLRDNDYVRVVEERLEIPDIEALHELHSLLQAKEELAGGSF